MDKNSSAPKQKTICQRLQMAIRTPTPFRATPFSSQQHQRDAAIASTTPPANVCLMPDRCARVSKQPVVPAKIEPHRSQPEPKVSAKEAQEKVMVLPIHGNENRVPSLGETGHMKSAAAESINRMFSEYIHRTKYKFHHTPSIVDTASFKY